MPQAARFSRGRPTTPAQPHGRAYGAASAACGQVLRLGSPNGSGGRETAGRTAGTLSGDEGPAATLALSADSTGRGRSPRMEHEHSLLPTPSMLDNLLRLENSAMLNDLSDVEVSNSDEVQASYPSAVEPWHRFPANTQPYLALSLC